MALRISLEEERARQGAQPEAQPVQPVVQQPAAQEDAAMEEEELDEEAIL